MIEAKMKEQAIFKLYTKYPFLNCTKSTETEKEEEVMLCMPSEEFVNKYCKDECDCCNGTCKKKKRKHGKEDYN